MRQQSRIANFPPSLLLLAVTLFGFQTLAHAFDTPKCDSTNVSGYKGGKCVVEIDRSKPASPPATTVPNGTVVIISVVNSRWNETTSFNTTTSQLASQDILLALLKNFITPLQSFIASQRVHGLAAMGTVNPIDQDQKQIEAGLAKAENTITNTSAELTCLEGYNVWVPSGDSSKSGQCTLTAYLDPPGFDQARQQMITDLNIAIKSPLPSNEISDANSRITDAVNTCKSATDPDAIKDCNALIDQWQSNQARYANIVTDLGKQIDALSGDLVILQSWAGSPPVATFTITQPRNRTSTVTVAETEIITKTPVTLATVAITWQSSPWVFSAGVMVSSLVNRTYAITPIISGGTVSTPTGSTDINTQVTENDNAPSVIAPMAQANFRFNRFSRYLFGDACHGHCAVLASVGMGPNLITKSADFGVGASLQIGSVLFTPVADFGRENFLSGGLTPNEALGTKPPSSLPTHTEWKTHVGLSLTYVIPLPQ